MNKFIILTGPESTGKTTLAIDMAEHFDLLWIPEYARTYLENINSEYTEEDIFSLAEAHRSLMNSYTPLSETLILDTDLLTSEVWLQYKYQRSLDEYNISWINKAECLYLLCDIDLPWHTDRLRENNNHQDRETILDMYRIHLESNKMNYIMINGAGEHRKMKAVESIVTFLGRKGIG